MKQKSILSIQNISKRFYGTQALNNVSFNVKRGEVHALMGENGAGKSTLVKIISGVIQSDLGKIMYDNKELHIKNPQQARAEGISVVYQELSLIPNLTVAENIIASSSKMNTFRMLKRDKLEKDTVELLNDNNINPKMLIKDLGIGSQQMVEIAGALSRNCKMLILDEPTASLTAKETEDLFKIINILKKRDVTVIYISHKLDEIFEIADSITVLKDGEFVDTLLTSKCDEEKLIKMMVGRDLKDMFPIKKGKKEECIMEVQDLTGRGFRDINFKLYKGEILGFAGLAGAGRTELFTSIFGSNGEIKGDICINNKKSKIKHQLDAMANGIGYLPEDRKQIGLFQAMSIKDNTVVASMHENSGRFLVDFSKVRKNTMSMINKMRIKVGSVDDKVRSLSGGNQQKVLLARWLLNKPKILIVDEPTRGIDVGAKQEVYQLLRELANAGVAIVMISSELPEILGMSDRIITMYHGEITAILEGKDRVEDIVASAIVGAKELVKQKVGETNEQ